MFVVNLLSKLAGFLGKADEFGMCCRRRKLNNNCQKLYNWV